MPYTGHPRDISESRLEHEIAQCSEPVLLRELVELARKHFGFFSRYTSHFLTNPWIASRLSGLAAGTRVLDIGSGLGPLPIWLAMRGIEVDCVDNSPIVRAYPIADDWNEWGFFDFSIINTKMKSFHTGIDNFEPSKPYDAISSIGVFAHIERAERVRVLKKCASWLKREGRIVMTLDVIANTSFLWNRLNKKELASPPEHGSMMDLMQTMDAIGLRIEDPTLIRRIPERPDTFMVMGIKV